MERKQYEILKSEVFRTCRIVKVLDSAKITLMIKFYMKENKNNIRVLITDENDKPLKIDADSPEIIFSNINFFEEMDYPYSYFTAENSSRFA